MRSRIPLFVLLAGALTFLVSLFMPWVSETGHSGFVFGNRSSQGIFTLLEGAHVEGWLVGAGDIAVLLVIAIVLVTTAVLRRPQLAARLPICSLAVALGYFTIGVVVEVHSLSGLPAGFAGRVPTLHRTWTYGFYLGLASAAVAVLSGIAYRRSELLRPHGAADTTAVVLGVALLVAYLLPWFGFAGSVDLGYSIHGTELAAAAIAALSLLLGAHWLHRDAGRHWRLPAAIAVAILTGGAASGAQSTEGHLYGTWIAVACAVLLVVLEAVRAWPARLPVPPQRLVAVRIGAAALLLVALFLPWREFHYGGGGIDGWALAPGAAAGSLCLLLVASPALAVLESYVLDAAVAVVIFVSMVATAFREDSFALRIGYGAFIGIAAAGILLGTALLPLRPGHVDRRRMLLRAVPLVASVLCVVAVVLPSWYVLPDRWQYQAAPLYGWLAVPGVLIGLYLVRLWSLRVRGPASTGRRLTLVPLVLLTLPALELIRFRNSEVLWSAIILVGLCLLLSVCGWIDEDPGRERVRVPEEIWRVDRLPEPES